MPPLHDLELYLQLVRVALEGLKLLVDLIQALWAGFRKIQRWYRSWRRREPLQPTERSRPRCSRRHAGRRRVRR